MKINPVQHRTLAEIVTGRLAALIIDGQFKAGDKLPSERELMTQLDVSRATLREGLKGLAENRLIEIKPGVGSFVRPLDRTNFAQATELAAAHRPSISLSPAGATTTDKPLKIGAARRPTEPPTSPLPVEGQEATIRIPNLRTDRLGTFDLISWWERDRVREAKVLIVGAGALGNEVAKNLALMGVGNIFIVDFDEIEAANLSRSVLFREHDNGRSKAEIAAARVRELNPDVHVQYFHGDIRNQLGLGVFRRMDAIIGCLDNREARLAINRFCYWLNKPWVDGAIQEMLGLVRVFVPEQGACYECTLTEQARREMSLRYSCPLLARANILLGKVPTTPTSASIVGAMQSQEALKLLHGIAVDPGSVTHINGMTNSMHTTHYVRRDDCESHFVYGEINELPLRSEETTIESFLSLVQRDLGPEALIELDQELVLSLECNQCQTVTEIMRPISEVSFEEGACPTCQLMRQVNMTHTIIGDEPFLHRTLASIGVPPLHILRAHNGQEYRFYELSGDLPDSLHFRHYEGPGAIFDPDAKPRIRLGPETKPVEPESEKPEGRIRLLE